MPAIEGPYIKTPDMLLDDPLELEKWALGQIKFYCWGQVTYKDIFNKDRWTNFCLYTSREHPYGYPCEYGNEAY